MVRIFWSILVCPFVATKGQEPSWSDVPLVPLLSDYVEALLVNETSNSELAPFLMKETSRNSKGGLIIDNSMQVVSSVDVGLFVPCLRLSLQHPFFVFLPYLLSCGSALDAFRHGISMVNLFLCALEAALLAMSCWPYWCVAGRQLER